MPTAVTWNGTAYSIPNAGELNWATLTDFLVDVGNNAQTTNFQKINTRIATSTPVTASASTDCVIYVDTTAIGAASTVNLPAGATGQVFYIVDGSSGAATDNITIDGSGAETINGGSTLVIARDNGGVGIAWDGTEWRVFNETFGGNVFNVDKATVFNEAGADVDFRIEGDTEPNLFTLDAGLECIGMGRAATSTRRLTVQSTGNSTVPFGVYNSSGNSIVNTVQDSSGNGLLEVLTSAAATKVRLSSNASTDSFFDAGNFGFGKQNPGAPLDVGGEFRFGPNTTTVGGHQNSQIVILLSGSNTADFTVAPDGSHHSGFLTITNQLDSDQNDWTTTTYSFALRGTTGTFTSLDSQNGTSGGESFGVSIPSNGVIRVSSTAATANRKIYLTYISCIAG